MKATKELSQNTIKCRQRTFIIEGAWHWVQRNAPNIAQKLKDEAAKRYPAKNKEDELVKKYAFLNGKRKPQSKPAKKPKFNPDDIGPIF